MNIDPNAPAFPVPDSHHADGQVEFGFNGLTIRAEIASRIMAGFAADAEMTGSKEEVASVAVEWADALIAELNKP